MEIVEKTLLDLIAIEGGVTVGREKTLAGGHKDATTITLDAATFEDEVEVGLVGAL